MKKYKINFNMDDFYLVKHKRINYYTDGDIAIISNCLWVSYPLKKFKKYILKPYGFIYTITNLKNGKIYVGKTTKYPLRRIMEHLKLNGNKLLANSIKIHCKDCFEIDVVKRCYSAEELAKEELKRIIRYRSSEKEYGYNLVISSALYKKSDKIVSRDVKGENNPMFGNGHKLPWYKKSRPSQSIFMENNNPMKGISVLDVWIEKYGEEIAVDMWQKKKDKAAETYRNKTEEEKLEHNNKKVNRGSKNGMYGKSVYSVWVEKYGKEEADIRKQKQKEKAKNTLLNKKKLEENTTNNYE